MRIGEEGVRAEEKQEVVTKSDKEAKERSRGDEDFFPERKGREHILAARRETRRQLFLFQDQFSTPVPRPD